MKWVAKSHFPWNNPGIVHFLLALWLPTPVGLEIILHNNLIKSVSSVRPSSDIVLTWKYQVKFWLKTMKKNLNLACLGNFVIVYIWKASSNCNMITRGMQIKRHLSPGDCMIGLHRYGTRYNWKDATALCVIRSYILQKTLAFLCWLCIQFLQMTCVRILVAWRYGCFKKALSLVTIDNTSDYLCSWSWERVDSWGIWSEKLALRPFCLVLMRLALFYEEAFSRHPVLFYSFFLSTLNWISMVQKTHLHLAFASKIQYVNCIISCHSTGE